MSDRVRLMRLWPFLRPYRRRLVLALLLLVASFAVELTGPWLVRLAIDGPVTAAAGDPEAALAGLLGIAAAYLATVVVGSWLGYAFTLTTARTGKSAITDLRRALSARLLRVDARWHDRQSTGRTVTRVTSDVENLDQLVSTGALQALFDLTKLLGLLVALAVFVPPVLGLAAVAVPVALATSLAFRSRARAAYGEVRRRLARQNGFTAELVGGVRTVRAFAGEELVDDRYDRLNAETREAWDDTVRCYAAFFAVIDFTLRISQAGLLAVGGHAVVAGSLTAGGLVQAWLYFGKLTGPIRDLGERYNVLQAALSSADRLVAVLDEPEGPSDHPDAVDLPRGPARVELDGVRFGYAPGRPVLEGISLEIAPGETCAIVGPTGAGKTTLLSLLSRVHEVDAGEIRIDGVPLQRVRLASLRRRVVVVPQEPVLFSGTLLDNLRWFDESVTVERAERALEDVGATELVRGRGGLCARIGEGGGTLSRGERQLIAFARALAAEPDLLVLDEATASVDSVTEARLQRALTALRRDRTVVVVAHRLSTVRDADRIVVLDHGHVVEAGRHDDLLARRGRYAAMVTISTRSIR